MKDTALTAASYDFFMKILDCLMIKRWRRELWSRAQGPRVLEAGVGTGLNTGYYSNEYHITALDPNRNFLKKARSRAEAKNKQADFVEGNIEKLPFPDNCFNTAVTTFLFCQLDKPLSGMLELQRVLKPGGRLLLLEHVLTKGFSGRLLTAISGPFYKITGDNIAVDTEIIATEAGFVNVDAKPLFTGAVKIISAEKTCPELHLGLRPSRISKKGP